MTNETIKTKHRLYVDSGMLWVGDPCYTLNPSSPHRLKSWEDFGLHLDASGYRDHQSSSPFGEGIGVAVRSGHGDGCYTLTVERSGSLVKKLTIDFD